MCEKKPVKTKRKAGVLQNVHSAALSLSREMDRELIVAHSGGKLLSKRVLFLETKEHPQISKPSFWKRGRENVFLQMF